MTFHYAGKYSGNSEDLPHGEHVPGAVKFKEAKDSKTLGLIANAIALVLFAIVYALMYLRAGYVSFRIEAVILFLFSLVPHEFLHALCFKGDVYMYQNLKHGMLFVVGPEHMSKGRFIFMSLLPNIVFAFIPFIAFMINPKLTILGLFGALGIASGAGDFINVFHAITQMPKGAYTYLYEFNSYWYLPKSQPNG